MNLKSVQYQLLAGPWADDPPEKKQGTQVGAKLLKPMHCLPEDYLLFGVFLFVCGSHLHIQ